MALEHNQDIQIVKFETSLADADVLASRGIFDPVLSGSFQHVDQTSPPSPLQAVFGGLTGTVETHVTNYQLQVDGLFNKWGSRYNMRYAVGREAGTFSPLPTYDGSVNTTITQPFLRGRGTAISC